MQVVTSKNKIKNVIKIDIEMLKPQKKKQKQIIHCFYWAISMGIRLKVTKKNLVI